jgi:hypothetical protein
LAAILLTVVIPRLMMLHVSVIDWDESIYALIGQQWLAGHVPHETVFDHKPIGLYAIFAAFFAVFGDTIPAIRLIAVVFVAATAWLLARLAQDHFGRDRALGGVIAGLYGLLTLTNGGLATNTEILINFFIVLAIYVIVTRRLDQRTSLPAALAAGASLGVALQVNYLAAVLLHAQQHLAFELVEQLGADVDVVVGARVRPADDHHDEVVVDDALVADRRLQQVPVLVDPGLQVERGGEGHRMLLWGGAGVAAMVRRAPAKRGERGLRTARRPCT